jgi:hypothetical protein
VLEDTYQRENEGFLSGQRDENGNPYKAGYSGTDSPTITERNKQIAETIGHEARHQLIGTNLTDESKFTAPFGPASFEERFANSLPSLPGTNLGATDRSGKSNFPGVYDKHESLNRMLDFKAYNDPEIYETVYEGMGMPRNLTNRYTDALDKNANLFTQQFANGGGVGSMMQPKKKRVSFKGGGADMGATDKAQERADRGYGSTAPADDRSTQQQTDNNNNGGGGITNTINNINKPTVFDKIKNTVNKVVDNPLTKFIDPRSKLALAMGGYRYLRDGVTPFQQQSIDDELENIKTKGGIVPYADGGRVNYNQGSNWWDTLDSQGMGVYNSMKRGGHDDATIQSQLQTLGYYDPNTAPPDSTPDIVQPNIVKQLGYSGGDNFSPYNPDPKSIKSVRQDPAIQANLEAIQRNQQLQSMGIQDPFANEMNPANAYYGDMPEDTSNQIGKQSMLGKAKQGLSGIVGNVKGLMDSPIGNAIGFAMNPVMGGLKGIASMAGNMLPANERAIQENIMGNMGFVVNDIGQIVSTGDYNDPSNVMAGYNLNKMTPATFKRRIDKIMNRRADQTDASRERIKSIREAQKQFEAAEKLKRLAVEEANLKKGRAPGGGRFDGGQAAYTNPDTGVGGGQFTDSQGNTDYQDAYDPGGGE